MRPSSRGQRCDCFPHLCCQRAFSRKLRELPHLLLRTSLWVLRTYTAWGLGSGRTYGLSGETCGRRCSLADSRVLGAKGHGRWNLPIPKDNPTAPISTEECPTAAVLLGWSPVITLVRKADTVRSELPHRSPPSHLGESPLAWPCHWLQSPWLRSSVGRSSLLSVNPLYSIVPLLLVPQLLVHAGPCRPGVSLRLGCPGWRAVIPWRMTRKHTASLAFIWLAIGSEENDLALSCDVFR